jgi:type I restriction enzyme R subunit
VRQALADVRERRRAALPDPALGRQRQIQLDRLAGAPADRPQSRTTARTIFDSVIVVTDRRMLDDQIQATIKQFMQVGATVGHAEHSGDLRRFIEQGKKIIISTVQKFPFILDEIGTDHRGKTFAIIIDEAHSSQGGKTSAAMSSGARLQAPQRRSTRRHGERRAGSAHAARKMLTNASYFAFTATPKNKTLEMFGEALPPDAEGKVKHRPFHSYTMKQAVQEGFILDVLKSYTPVESYYKLMKKIEDDPEFDTKKAKKKLRPTWRATTTRSGSRPRSWSTTSTSRCWRRQKIGGQARAMVVTSSIERAIQYFHAFQATSPNARAPTRRSSRSPASTSSRWATRSARRRSTALRASDIAEKHPGAIRTAS